MKNANPTPQSETKSTDGESVGDEERFEEHMFDAEVKNFRKSIMTTSMIDAKDLANRGNALRGMSLAKARMRSTQLSVTYASGISRASRFGSLHLDRARQKKFKYNPKVSYVDDIEHPTGFQRQFAFTEEPFWYLYIRGILVTMIIWLAIDDMPNLTNFYSFKTGIFLTASVIYTIDFVVSFIMQHLVMTPIVLPNPIAKPMWLYVIDIIAIFPIQYFVTIPDYILLRIFIRCKSTLLITRLKYEFLQGTFCLETSLIARISETVILALCIRLSYTSIILSLNGIAWTSFWEVSWLEIKETLYRLDLTVLQVEIPIIIGIYLVNFLVYFPAICLLIFTYTTKNEAKYTYIAHVQLFETVLVTRYGISQENADQILEYLKMKWKTRADYMLLEAALAEKICCESTYQAMNQDRNIFALQHCPMLRDMNFHILRYLAQMIKPKMYLKDVYLYKFPMHKVAMFYVASGEVHLLSSENGQSPILKLTAGSCLGTMVLVRPYRSNSNLRTGSNCELYELKARDFCEFARYFPDEYRSCIKYVQNKIDEAIFLRTIKHMNEPQAVDKTIVWIKRELHNLMSMTAPNPGDHRIQNIYLMQYFKTDYLNDVIFTKMNLHVLSIKPRDSQYTDLVFIKPSCPWVFQPDSPLLKVMWKLVFLQSIITFMIITYQNIEHPVAILSIAHCFGLICMIVEFIMLCMTPLDLQMPRIIYVILLERCKRIPFILDLVSILISINCVTGSPVGWFLAPLRLWRVIPVIQHIETNTVNHLFFKQLLYFILVYVILWFEFSALIYMIFESKGIWYYSMLAAIEQTIIINNDNEYFYIFPNHVIRFIIGSILASSYHMFRKDLIEIANAINSTNRFQNSASVQKRNVSLSLRINSFLSLLVHDFHYLQLKKHRERFMQFPDYIDQLIKPENLLKYMNQSQFFAKFPRELVNELVQCSTVETFYDNALILTRGVRCNNFYILIEGQVCSVELSKVHRVAKGADLNCLEVMFGIPSVRHFVAFSHVIIVSIAYKHFIERVKRFPLTSATYLKTVEILRKPFKENLLQILYGKPQVVIEVSRNPKTISFFTYKCVMYQDSFDAFNYFPPFDRLGIFSFIRFFLLRVTFHPEGKFYLTWEIFRISCICIGLIIYLIPSYIQQEIELYALIFDLVGFVDMYIRLHVCYYNNDGILVKHPLYTAKHYVYRSFIIDLISVLPLQFYSDFTVFRSLIRSLRLIQIYRVIAYKSYTYQEYFLFTLLGVLYIMTILVLAISTLIFELHCRASTIYDLKCPGLNTTHVHFYLNVIFITTSELTGTGVYPTNGRHIIDPWTDWFFSGTLFFSIFWHGFALGRVYNAYLTQSIFWDKTTSEMCKLIKFMKSFNVPLKLCNHVREYFDVQWNWVGKNNIDDVVLHMDVSLKRDLLFHVYGDPFIRFNHFSTDYRNLIDFYKNIFLGSTTIICPTFGKFISLYDVDSSVYFVYRGVVEILGTDKQVITTLLPGSIFGNLLDAKESRQVITAAAKCNTQCLCIKTSGLLEILEYYPKIQSHYKNAATKNRWFIKSRAKVFNRYIPLTKAQTFRKKVFTTIVGGHMVVVCYVGNLLNLYQIATGEDNYIFLGVLYFLDLLHIFGVLARYFLPVKNNFGYWCIRVRDIYSVRGSKLRILVDILTALPIDLIILIGGSIKESTYWYSALRGNRSLRIYYVFMEYITLKKKYVTSYKQWFRKCIAVWYEVVYFSFFMATMFVLLDVNFPGNMVEQKGRRDLNLNEIYKIRIGPSIQRLLAFLMYFRVVTESIVLEKSSHFETDQTKSIVLTVFLFLCYGIHMVILCHCYGLVYEIYSRNAFSGTITFNNMLPHSESYTEYIKGRIIKNSRYVFSRNELHSLRALESPSTPMYLTELILNSCFGNYLTKHPIFKHCHSDFLRQVGRGFRVVDIPRGNEVIHKYDHRKCMFFVLQGCVVALEQDDDIIENYLFVLRPGDCFCFLLGLSQEMCAEYTFTCRVHSTILELEYERWADTLNYFPATDEILKNVGSKFRNHPYLRLRLPKEFAHLRAEKQSTKMKQQKN